MTLRLRPLFLLALASLAVSTAQAQRAPVAPPACADFYGHANAAWLAGNPLPAGREHFSRWDQLNAQAARQAEALFTDTRGDGGPASAALATLATSAADLAAIEAAGLGPLQPLLQRIEGIRKAKDVGPVIAALHAAGVPVLVSVEVERSADGSTRAVLAGDALGMPDASFYGNPDEAVRAVDLRYRTVVSEWLRLSGTPGPKLAEESGAVMVLEGELAKLMVRATPRTVAGKELARLAPNLDLPGLLKALQLDPAQAQIAAPAFFPAVDDLIKRRPVATWKAYLRAHAIASLAPALHDAARKPWENLNETLLEGRATPRTRAQWLADWLRAEAPELVEAGYRQCYLPPARLARAQATAEAVRTAARESIAAAGWLDAAGKQAALARLDAVQLQFDREIPAAASAGLSLSPGPLAGQLMALRRWRQALARQPVALPPSGPVPPWQPLLAYFPERQALVATAALLQPPVFGDAAGPGDFGGFGALVGQQLAQAVHRFEGPAAQAFAQRGAMLQTQFAAYAAAGGPTKVNAAGTQAQNLADLAGLEWAWRAFSAGATPAPAQGQAFFTGWATLWARQDEPTALARAQATARWAPARWRVNGPLINLPAFAQAYACTRRDAMERPPQRQVALWR